MPAKPSHNGFWISGVNSLLDPNSLKSTEYQWGQNVSNRGGVIGTRAGFCSDIYSTIGVASATINLAQKTGSILELRVTHEVGSFVTGQSATISGALGNTNEGTFPVIGYRVISSTDHRVFVANPNGVTNVLQDGTITAKIGIGNPQGMSLFKPKDKKVHKIVAANGRIWVSEYPFASYSMLADSMSIPIVSVAASGEVTFTLDASASQMALLSQAGDAVVSGTVGGLNDGTYSIISSIGNKTARFLYGGTHSVTQASETGTLTIPIPLTFDRQDYPPVFFETTIKNVTEDADGNLTVIDPYPILMMGTGFHRQAMWDGKIARRLGPEEAFMGKSMKWIGGRLWTASGKLLHAGNLLDPLSTTEESLVADGGYFSFPSDITGLGATPDQKSLLVFTDYTTYAIQAGITDRTQWRQTIDFQKVILPGIGCAAPKSPVNQFGVSWWYSHGGLIGLDSALQTYHTSKVHYEDSQMARSSSTLSPDISKICCGVFDNYLLVSVPSQDRHNAHTWVLDQSVLQTNESNYPEAWSGIYTGIRPVEWASGIVEGVSRIYALSRDYYDSTYVDYSTRPWLHKVGVWEAFVGARMDIPNSGAKRIPCSFETKMLGLDDGGLKDFLFAELDLAEIEGIVDLQVHYAGRRGGYTQILRKTLTAASGSVGWPFYYGPTDIASPVPTIEEDSTIQFFRPQTRMVRTNQVSGGRQSTNDSGAAESIYNQNVDRSFSLLVKWTGKMTILGVRIFTQAHEEPTAGECNSDETDNDAVTMQGARLSDIHEPIQGSTTPSLLKSLFRRNLTPRFTDEFYSST